MGNKVLYINPQKCTGCGRCELACSFKHENEYRPMLSRVRLIYFENNALGIPTTCSNCEEKPCVDVCPTGAIKATDDGAVTVNEDLCIGCKQCIFACPFGAVGFNEEKGVAIKCDLCGGDPECVKACPSGAIQYIELDKAVMQKKRDYLVEIIKKEGVKQ
jgi:anaerobic carbon-monoxide dehydrogenase iron sulfur subunit